MPADRLIRFSITVPEDLLNEFEAKYYTENRANRSNAVRSLMRKYISAERWRCTDGQICATITIIYDHHLPELTRSLTSAQHDSGDVIICSTHVHLNHNSCLECIITKGNAKDIKKFIDSLENIRGIKSLNVNVTADI